ncbi:hypothetical protein KSP39_PZI016223 [Platanthera zijinensis]|uniref:Uncharacterized protein n=1 Tax=Platanthera zijinensis TaxID=2320716 RepID=A0AAP0B7X5_9ASPA
MARDLEVLLIAPCPRVLSPSNEMEEKSGREKKEDSIEVALLKRDSAPYANLYRLWVRLLVSFIRLQTILVERLASSRQLVLFMSYP